MHKKQKLNDNDRLTQTKLNFSNGSLCVTENYGESKMIIGDCIQKLTDIQTGSVSLVFSSPPYNIGKIYEKTVSLENYLENIRNVIVLLCSKIKQGGNICWEVGNFVDSGEIKPLDLMMHDFFIEGGMKLQKRFIWTYGHGLHCQNRFSGRYETISWYVKKSIVSKEEPKEKEEEIIITSSFLKKEWEEGVFDIPNVKSNHIEKTEHPCQFPIELVERFVLVLTQKGDLVLDPFAGVGTTVIAAVKHNRRAIGIEIDKNYARIAESRISLLKKDTLGMREMGTLIHVPSKDDSISKKPLAWDDIVNPSLEKELKYSEKTVSKQQMCTVANSSVYFQSLREKYSLIIWFLDEKETKKAIKKMIECVVNNDCNICFIVNHKDSFTDNDVKLLKTFDEYSLRNRIVAWNSQKKLYSSIFWFTKGDYYFDVDSVRVPSKYPGKKSVTTGQFSGNPLGKNPSDVWRDCCNNCSDNIGIGDCHLKRLLRALSDVGQHILIVTYAPCVFENVQNIKRNIFHINIVQ